MSIRTSFKICVCDLDGTLANIEDIRCISRSLTQYSKVPGSFLVILNVSQIQTQAERHTYKLTGVPYRYDCKHEP